MIPIANQYAPQWPYCDASEDCFDTTENAGKDQVTPAAQLFFSPSAPLSGLFPPGLALTGSSFFAGLTVTPAEGPDRASAARNTLEQN
jgi:hypothetical protein